MRYWGVLCVLMIFGVSNLGAETSLSEYFEKQKKESVEFNAKVTDLEIIGFLEFKYENDPDLLKDFRGSIGDETQKNTFLSNYRKFHEEGNIQIPILRGLSETDIKGLRGVFDFKKKEYYEAKDAERRMKKYSMGQLRVVLEEAKKLINSYEKLQTNPKENVVKITTNFPPELKFLKLQFVYLREKSCNLYLQKGIGKAIGYSVSKEGEWKLNSFNEYKSWDKQEVVIR